MIAEHITEFRVTRDASKKGDGSEREALLTRMLAEAGDELNTSGARIAVLEDAIASLQGRALQGGPEMSACDVLRISAIMEQLCDAMQGHDKVLVECVELARGSGDAG